MVSNEDGVDSLSGFSKFERDIVACELCLAMVKLD